MLIGGGEGGEEERLPDMTQTIPYSPRPGVGNLGYHAWQSMECVFKRMRQRFEGMIRRHVLSKHEVGNSII